MTYFEIYFRGPKKNRVLAGVSAKKKVPPPVGERTLFLETTFFRPVIKWFSKKFLIIIIMHDLTENDFPKKK